MSRPESSYEAASYDLTQFRERRMNERRSVARGSMDRRASRSKDAAGTPAVADVAAAKAPDVQTASISE